MRQTMSSWRLVAVCHGESPAVAETIRSLVPDALILTAPEDGGLPDVLNLGLASCTAEFVARIDSDDIPAPDRFERQTQFLSSHPDVALVASPVTLIDESGAAIGGINGPSTSEELVRGLRWKCVIQHPSVMFRRTTIAELGGYDPAARHVEDYELWLRLASVADVETLAEPLTEYRVHPGQVTRTKVIPRPARALVGQARRALARSRGESVAMARLRQFVWSSRQVLREMGSRTH
jgi:glycosyltransferase involved in cell wall biosynthesis